jgi:hypothetical protein
MFCSIVWWANSDTFPTSIASNPSLTALNELANQIDRKTSFLCVELIFLYVVTISGLARAFSDLAQTTHPNGAVPRGRWLYVICGLMTICSGCFGGPPILISTECGGGIKAGGRTGLSTIVGGVFFGIATFFTPFFSAIPSAATAPLLIAIGVVLFANTTKIDWTNYAHAFPAYIVLFLIPFTYSIVNGVVIGWAAYLVLSFFSGDLLLSTRYLMMIYTPNLAKKWFNEVDILADVETRTDKKNDTVSDHKVLTTYSLKVIGDDEVDANPIGLFGNLEVPDKPIKVDFFSAFKIAKFGPHQQQQDNKVKEGIIQVELPDIDSSKGKQSHDGDERTIKETSNPMV